MGCTDTDVFGRHQLEQLDSFEEAVHSHAQHMAWFWFLLCVILALALARVYLRFDRAQRLQNGISRALAATAGGRRPRDARDAASRFLDYAEHSIDFRDFDTYIQRLCQDNGVPYEVTRTSDGYADLTPATRVALVERIATAFYADHASLERSIRETASSDRL